MVARARRVLLAALAAAAVVLGVLGPAGPAEAAAYRYWTYWLGGPDGWTFASTGPAFRTPADGSVEGWRFAVSTEAGDDRPRADAGTAFDDACAATPPVAGRKRVAVVIDPGVPADAPPGESPPPARTACVVADPGATGYAVLRAAGAVRVDGGLVCAVDGYPARECAELVGSDATGATSAATRPGGVPSAPVGPPERDDPEPPAPADASRSSGTAPTPTTDTETGRDAESTPAAPAPPPAEDTTYPAGGTATTEPPTSTTLDPAPTPVALAAGDGGGGSPVGLLLVLLGGGALGAAAWLRVRRGPS